LCLRSHSYTWQHFEHTYVPRKFYCHVWGVSVTNNNGFWIWWLGLLALCYNYSQLQKLTDWSHSQLRQSDKSLWRIRRIESESYVTTDGQSASVSWYKAPIRGLRPDFYCRTEYGIRLTFTFLIPWGALSDERTGLSFEYAAGPCQRSLSRVLVPWDLRPYFTVSDLRLSFSSPPTTRRVTVEVFDPASTRGSVEFTN
jgi:hypothetical protein